MSDLEPFEDIAKDIEQSAAVYAARCGRWESAVAFEAGAWKSHYRLLQLKYRVAVSRIAELEAERLTGLVPLSEGIGE